MRPSDLTVRLQICLLQAVLLLLFCTHKCDANDPPFKFRGPADSAQFDEPPNFDFHGDQFPVTLQPINGHRLDRSIFQPSPSMDMHFLQLEDKKFPTLLKATIEHLYHDYVNLESIEPFLYQPVVCRMAKFIEKTDLDLHFKSREAFEMAQEYWMVNGRTILFVVEGPYCFEAPGTRSVYRTSAIRFDTDRKLVVIEAEPLHAQIHYETGWTHNFTLQSQPHRPEEHRVVPRASLILTHDAGELRKRGFNLDLHFPKGFDAVLTKEFDHDLGDRHNFFKKPGWYNGPHLNLSCIKCHAKGEFDARFALSVTLSPHNGREGCEKKDKRWPRRRSENATAFLDEYESIQPMVYSSMEEERIRRHRRAHSKLHHLRKRGEFRLIPALSHDLTCSEEDPTFPVCHEYRQVPRDLQYVDPCNAAVHPIDGAKKWAKCLLKSFWNWDHEDECREDAKEDIKEIIHDPKGYAKQFFLSHLDKFEISFEVVQEIDIRFQLELAGRIAVAFWFDVDFMVSDVEIKTEQECIPIPGVPFLCLSLPIPVKPSFGWFFSLDGGSPTGPFPLSGLPSEDKNADGTHKSIGKKMSMGSAMAKTSLDSAKDGQGFKVDPVGDAMHGLPVPTLTVSPVGVSLSLQLEAAINLTLPGFHVHMAKGTLIWRPLEKEKANQLVNGLTIKTEYLPAELEIKEPKLTMRMSAGPRWRFNALEYPASIKPAASMAGISQPLALGGHFQPIRMDHIFSVVPPNDPDQCANGTLKYEMLIRVGLDAYVMVLFQRLLDTNWIAPLQHSGVPSETIGGLWFSKRVFKHCFNDIHIDTDEGNRKLNKKLREIQQPLVDAVAAIGEKLSAIKAEHGMGEVALHDWHKEDFGIMELLEYASWQNRVGPGMYWRDCEVGVHPGCDSDNVYLVAEDSPAKER